MIVNNQEKVCGPNKDEQIVNGILVIITVILMMEAMLMTRIV